MATLLRVDDLLYVLSSFNFSLIVPIRELEVATT